MSQDKPLENAQSTEDDKLADSSDIDRIDEILVLFSKRLAVVQGEYNANVKLSQTQLHAEEAQAEAKAALKDLLLEARLDENIWMHNHRASHKAMDKRREELTASLHKQGEKS